jgi:hypothetical protein
MKRDENESWSDFKLRRRVEKLIDKKRLKGVLYWNSNQRGTYIKKNIDEIVQKHKVDTEKTSSE